MFGSMFANGDFLFDHYWRFLYDKEVPQLVMGHPVHSQIQKLENKCKYDFLIQTDSLWPLLVLSQTQISQILENRPYFELWLRLNS